jgi:hypothetical protein
MSRADRHTRAALDVAAWLDEIGEKKRANDVRAVCRSLSTARVTMAALYRDNMALRGAIDQPPDFGHQGKGASES